MGWPTLDLDTAIMSHDTAGKRWLHALCLALNERQGCLGLTKTLFLKPDGSEDSDLDLADFTGLWIGGPDDGAITNLNRCMAGLKSMIVQTHPAPVSGTYATFTTVSGSSGSGYGLSGLEAAVGLGAFPEECDSWVDLNFWKQLKESFDLLIHARRKIVPIRGSVSERTGAGVDPSEAWFEAYSDTPATRSGSGDDHLVFRVSIPSAGVYVGLFREGPTTVSINCVGMSGTLVESYLHAVIGVFGPPQNFPTGWSLGSLNITSSVADTLIATSDVALGALNSLAFDCDSTPTAAIPTSFGSSQLRGLVRWADLYFDIATILTDQA